MKLYIHGGESLMADNENLIDAYLLGASRVGHGLNLYRYPDLQSRYVKAEICLEVCPISNERLEYTKDLRNHLATEYLKSGVTMALCSDDPTYMEYQTLTDDFFAATVCWNLDLSDIKQFGVNSIMYSGLDEDYKRIALKNYKILWDAFIDKIYCKANELDQTMCPVCGKYSFTENYEICPVCKWENDPVQRKDPCFTGGANKMSLNSAREKYRNDNK